MDKNAIKTFAVESRRKMIKSVKFQASLLGITADEIKEPISNAEGMETYDYGAGQHTIYDEDIKKRESLVREINNKGFANVVEEVAYTWFNRIIAIRYMEVNDYLPTYTRVLSSEIEGKIEPDIITEALDLDLDYSDEDREKILKFKMDNDNDKLFQFLFIKQCNKLNEILPGLFEKTDDYMELLLDIKFTDEDSVVRQLVDTISEDDFGEQVEIIGWMYQYYISEKKDEVININKGNIKKEDIPAATQLFTTDWVVKYMVDNSLGRYWIERNPSSNLEDSLEFYLDEADQTEEVQLKLNQIRSESIQIEDLKFLDPCMGSGHILVYAFDVFFEIYKELGYQENGIPKLILENNIFGLDIDDRAYQLAYFAIMMKARKYDRQIFKKEVSPSLYSIKESDLINFDIITFINNKNQELAKKIEYLKDIFRSGKEFGSLIQVKNLDYDLLEEELKNIISEDKSKLTDILIFNIIENNILPLVYQAKLLSQKYDVVVTNPPYMNKFEKSFKDFANKNYKKYSKDLFSMFIYRNFNFCKEKGYSGFMTPFVWMFIKNYEDLRKYIIENKSISSLIQLEYSAFSEATVPICTFVLSNFNNEKYNGIYLKLSEFTGGMDVQKEKVLEIIDNPIYFNDKNRYIRQQKDFKFVPGNIFGYWLDGNLINNFKKQNLGSICDAKKGIVTGDNNKYMRMLWEVENTKIGIKWIPCVKGGNFKKYYGNVDMVIDWSNNAQEYYKNNKSSSTLPEKFCFKEGITYTSVSSKGSGFRYLTDNCLFSNGGPSILNLDEPIYCIGFLNSNIAKAYLQMLNPTINLLSYNVSALPIIIDNDYKNVIIDLTKENIFISRENWDSFELSLDFKTHPFLLNNFDSLENSFLYWKKITLTQFYQVKENEIKLNEFFNKIYGSDLNPDVENNDITIELSDYENDIKSFISYAVGCMFGRYSLDEEGLQFAGGEFNINNYSKFIPDDDNIIPVLDTEYFNDDIVGRFVEFVKVCFGEETLEENLDFIAGALKKKGKTSREIIRNYFLTDFFKDHAQTYKKTPIYWQFDSGKQNAFKCLIYMHRYEPGLVARVRTDYLHKTQKAIEQNLAQCESIIANSSNKSEVSKATKDKSKYIKQLDEIKVYDEALAHIANQRIEIDLDDGVKVNHAKFQNVEISKEGQKAKKINLLKKI